MGLGNAIGIGVPMVYLGLGGGGGGAVTEPKFVIQVKTDNEGDSNDNQFKLPWYGTYDVDWGDGTSDSSVTNTQTHTYSSAGNYTIKITPVSGSVRIAFGGGGDKLKLLKIINWGDLAWTSFSGAFQGCANMIMAATDIPDLSGVASMSYMFSDCSNFSGNSSMKDWDTSNVDSLDRVFRSCTKFNANINAWDTSKVTDMSSAFENAETFNQPLSNWDTSKVTSLYTTFKRAISFNQDISSWDVSKVTVFGGWGAGVFQEAQSLDFNYIKDWDVSSGTSFGSTFQGCRQGNIPVQNWNVSAGTDFEGMFYNCSNVASLDLSGWTPTPLYCKAMFQGARGVKSLSLAGFNMTAAIRIQDMFKQCSSLTTAGVSAWDLSLCENMVAVFEDCSVFVDDISNWNITSALTRIDYAFYRCTNFNSNISSWDVSSVTDMRSVFASTELFNQPLNSWDTGNVTTMQNMFNSATSFNQPIGNWDVSSVTDMRYMFPRAYAFNQPLNSWNPANVTNMYGMFELANAFDQSLSNWNVEKVTDFRRFMTNILLSTANYNSTLIGWATQTLKPNEQIDFGLSSFSNAALASRNSIISNYGWTITDSGEVNEFATLPTGAFVYSAKTTGTYTIPTKSGETYNYDVSTSDGQTFTGATGNTTITFPSAGTYDIAITGNFARPYFQSDQALDSVKQWSNTPLTSLEQSFDGCYGFRNLATNAPDLSICTSMRKTFYNQAGRNYKNVGLSRYVNSLNNWNTSNITNMRETFSYTRMNYANLGNWNTSNVTTMKYMFSNATEFNNGGIDNLNNWDVSKVTDFGSMFSNCDSLKQYIGGWQFGVPTTFDNMFNDNNSLDSSFGLANWNTANVTNINNIFNGAPYVDIASWNINNVTNFGYITPSPHLTISQYENLLVSWAAQTPQSNRSFSAGASRIVPGSAGETAKNTLINTYNWTITDGGNTTNFTQPYVYSINTSMPGEGTASQYTLPQGIDSYYTATFSDGQQFTNTYGGNVVTFAAPGVYDVSIVGSFTLEESLYENDPEYLKIVEIKAWGNMIIKGLYRTFYECRNLQKVTATSSPNIDPSVTSVQSLFNRSGVADISFVRQWDVSNITDFRSMFDSLDLATLGASADLSGLDVSSAVTMQYMFYGNTFGGAERSMNLSNWNMPNLTNARDMFNNNRFLAELNITGWSTPSLIDMSRFAFYAQGLTTIVGIEYLNTSSTTKMYQAFYSNTKLNISLAAFDMSNVTDLRDIFRNTNAISVANYDATLISWSNQVLKPNEQTNFGTAKYTLGGAAEAARNTIINTYGWTITDGGGI
jgi:surface protein|tara:strand:- start:277 stop:4182 length:3906 start_codon:yes stop_codon:yes gene_type:complete